jgi:phosphatidate cytidylyltransferase
MFRRVLIALFLIPVVAALVWWGPPALLAAAASVVTLLALHEFFGLGERLGLRAFKVWTMICATGLFYAQWSSGIEQVSLFRGALPLARAAFLGTDPIVFVLLVFVFGCAGIGLATRRPLQEVLPAISISAAGLLFIALPFTFVVRIHEIGGIGRQLTLFTLVLVWAGDILAYFTGKTLGRFRMAPALSPKKTWEGALGNLVASLLVAFCFARWMEMDTLNLLVIAALANMAGQMGDLIESAYKRGAAVKDSSALLPGHGGMLDRIDSLILACPVVWILYQWLAIRNS